MLQLFIRFLEFGEFLLNLEKTPLPASSLREDFRATISEHWKQVSLQ